LSRQPFRDVAGLAVVRDFLHLKQSSMQSYASATLKIFVVGFIGFVALSGCEKEFSEAIGETHPFLHSGRIQADSSLILSDSLSTDTLISWPDTIPFPFPHDSIPMGPIPTDSIAQDSTFFPPMDTLSYNIPDSFLIDSTARD
jgi:hypothetical protein